MHKFIVDHKIFEDYSDLEVGVIVFKDVNNKQEIDLSSEWIAVNNSIKHKFSDMELAEYPIIKKWRSVYKSFGEKRARSSIEALIRRIINGNTIPSINPLVDIYNIMSLKYEIPCGGEDLSAINYDIELTYALGQEDFISLGESEIEHPSVNEIVYKCGNDVICRNFNYRESDKTKLSEETSCLVLVMEEIDGNKEKLERALTDLATSVSSKLGGVYYYKILEKNSNEMTIEL